MVCARCTVPRGRGLEKPPVQRAFLSLKRRSALSGCFISTHVDKLRTCDDDGWRTENRTLRSSFWGLGLDNKPPNDDKYVLFIGRKNNMPQQDASPSSLSLESHGVSRRLEHTSPQCQLSRLANSHAAGVLHNDIASRNALLSTTQSGGRGLLCDFGISRVLRGGVEAASLIDTELDGNKWPILQMPRESLEHPFPLTAESDSWMYGLFLYEVSRARITACSRVCPRQMLGWPHVVGAENVARGAVHLLVEIARLLGVSVDTRGEILQWQRFGFNICRRGPDLPPGDGMWFHRRLPKRPTVAPFYPVPCMCHRAVLGL